MATHVFDNPKGTHRDNAKGAHPDVLIRPSCRPFV